MEKEAARPGDPLHTLFAPEAIDAETQAFNQQVEAILTKLPAANTMPPQQTRDLRESGRGPFGPIVLSKLAQARTLPGPGSAPQLPVRVLVPESGPVQGVYLHLHGGGWTFGRAHHSDVPNESLTKECGLAVVSVDYRLAPEHPYPAGPDDCEAAALWLAKNAQAEFGTSRLLIGGESAGAHLSALTLLRLRDRHGFTEFSAANLVYGAFDLCMTPSQRLWGNRPLVLTTPLIEWFVGNFVPAGEGRRSPDVSPLYADLAGLPPALFTVGTLDPLVDDTMFMWSRWLAAGNRAELAVYPGGIHGFTLFPLPLATRANQRIADFLRAAVADRR